MLHEVLFALVGAPGYVVRAEDGGFRLAPGVAESFLHPSEVALVARICALGHHFRGLQNFVRQHRVGAGLLPEMAGDASGEGSSGAGADAGVRPPLVYARAIALGVEELLHEYTGAVADAERKFLEDPALPLSHLQYLMRDHAVVLPAVHALVADIAEQGLRGGKLVDAVQKRCTTGVPCVEVAMRRLLDVVHGLLLHQLNAWVVHGVLDDSNKHEFFVADALSYTSSSSEGGDVPSSRRGATEAVEPVHEWHSRFSLRAAMLPSCIPAVLGEKVVFIGKAVRVLTERCELVTIQDRQRFSNMLRMLLRNAAPATAAMERADEAPPSPVTTAEPTSVAAAAPESAVTRLPPRMSYNPVELSCTINELRAVVARQLWQLVVVDSQLLKPLQAMRDYFLLGRGDLYQYFIHDCYERNVTQMRPGNNTEKELNVLYRSAAAKCGVEDDADFGRLRVELRKDGGGGTGARTATSTQSSALSASSLTMGMTAFDTWRRLSLSMEMAWPLELLLNEPMQSRYNELFPLLFTVKRVQMALHASWRPLVQLQNAAMKHRSLLEQSLHQAQAEEMDSIDGLRSQVTAATQSQMMLASVLFLRRHMGFVIDNLQHYFQVDVIDAAFGKLTQDVSDADDFESVVAAHAEYLTVTSAQCFLHQRVITQAVDMLLESALSFCDNVRSTLLEAPGESFSIPDVERVAQAFASQVQFLFKVLNGARVQQSAPHLARLLLRLDFSGHYSAVTNPAS